MIKIQISTDYITLGQFLKFAGVIDSGAYAKTFLGEEEVYVNGELENRRGRKLYPGYIIEVLNNKYEVVDWCFS